MNRLTDYNRKIVAFDEVSRIVDNMKTSGKRVIQSPGVFDIIHPGIVQHLDEAKAMGDVLVVTVTRDSDVRRGPGRPVFPDKMRAENVAALEPVDYVAIVEDTVPFECVTRLQPDVFVKGHAHRERDKKIHDKLFQEERELYFGKIEILETSGFSCSASLIINDFLDIYPDETKAYLRNFSSRYSFNTILEAINSLRDLNVLLVGDGIIDEYHYCMPLGKSAKAQLVVNKFLTAETFAGGVFAVANHVAGICDNVTLITMLGEENSEEEFIRGHLKPNVRTCFFHRDDGPTIVKKRYVDNYRHQKLFEINYLNDTTITGKLVQEVLSCLNAEIPNHDLILLADFGHGLISRKIIDFLQETSCPMAVNTQTNAANTGFNMVTKYRRPRFVCLDETEARLSMQNRFDDIRNVAKDLIRILETNMLIITLGKKGAMGIDNDGTLCDVPIFSSKVLDTVGAGDAFFSFTAPCAARRMPLEMITFIGNAVGALAVQIMGNKRPVEKHELLEFVHTLLNNH